MPERSLACNQLRHRREPAERGLGDAEFTPAGDSVVVHHAGSA